MNWLLIKNSALVGGATTAISVVMGSFAALFLRGAGGKLRQLVTILGVISVALPPFLVTNCWLHYLGAGGAWRSWLPFNIFSLGGTVWILVLLTWPISMLWCESTLRNLDTPLLESDPAVSGWSLISKLILPMIRGSIGQAAVVTFVLAVNNFSVPAILQVKVLPAETWLRFNTALDSKGSLLMSLPMVLLAIGLIAMLLTGSHEWRRLAPPDDGAVFRRQMGPRWFAAAALVTIFLCLASAGIPLFQLASLKRTWTEMPSAIQAAQVAIGNSLVLSCLAATAVVGIGVAFGIRNSGTQRVLARWLAQALWLPFLAPGVLIDIGLISALNRPFFANFYQSTGVIVLAFAIRYIALGWNGAAQAFRSVDRELADAGRLESASHFQLFRFVHWPQIGPQLAATWYIIFLLCLWDVESIILVLPPGGQTLATTIFNLLHYGYNAQVNALCFTLLLVALFPIAAWQVWTGASRVRNTFLHGVKSRSYQFLQLFAGVCLCALASGCGGNANPRKVSLDSILFNGVEVVGSRGVGVGELNKPRSVAVDAADNVYAVDMTGRVQKFSPTGSFLLSWQMPQTDLGKPKGMCRGHEGEVIVVEPHYQRVNYFTPMGNLLAQWGKSGTNFGEFKLPRAIAVDSRGDVFVSEYGLVERVQKFKLSWKDAESDNQETVRVPATGDGKGAAPIVTLIKSFGHAGTSPGEFNRPEGLCVDAQDRLYVADSCNHRIEIFSNDGQFIRTYGHAGTGKGELSYPYDICVDKQGRQYVCEFGNSRVQIFDSNDNPIDMIGGPGAAPGQMSNPWGVALDSAGNLYVADSQNHRVQKFIRRPPDSAKRNANPSGPG